MTTGVTLAELADSLGCTYQGDPDIRVSGVGTLENADKTQLSFLANPRYRKFLDITKAGIVVMPTAESSNYSGPALLSNDPYVDYARAASFFDHSVDFEPGVHPSAWIDDGAEIGTECFLGANAVIDAGAIIGSRVHIGHGTVVGRNCVIGDGSFLASRVTLGAAAKIGRRVLIHHGAVIGSDGFGIAFKDGCWIKVPQLGSVVIGDDCEIGANTTIDRGALDDTVLEEDVRLDNQIQIAHNVHIGAHTAMAGCSAVAGSARIGRYCLIGGGAGILGHLEVTDRVTITAMSLVTRSITESGEYSSGTPLQPNKEWRRNAVRIRQLDDIARRLHRLEKEN